MRAPLPEVKISHFALKGGEDMVTAPMYVDPGALLISLNYEPGVSHGYRRIDGYERFDGQAKPSKASYWLLSFTDGQIEPQADDIVQSGTWSGIVLAVDLGSGDYSTGDAAGTLVLFDVTGEFSPESALQIDSQPFAIGQSLIERGEQNNANDAEYIIAAIEARRERIQAVPGSGPVRGVAVFDGVVYAWRDNAGATAGVLHKATDSGWEQVSAGFPPGGRYETIVHNFYATAGGHRLFGANGIGRAFMFDGTTVTFLDTGLPAEDDKPGFVIAHKDHLFLGYSQGTVIHSGIGDPENWDKATGGAGEIGVSDPVTGFASLVGGVLAVFSRNQIRLIYGVSGADWQLVLHAPETGAIPYTVQTVGDARFLSDRGAFGLSATQSFGDFNAGTFSQRVQPYILEIKDRVIAGLRVKEKDQYRLLLADGTGLIAKFRSRDVEFTRIDYGFPVSCAASAEDANGDELILVGSGDGYVYQIDSGFSFDGREVVAVLRLPFGSLGLPYHMKRFRKAVFEMEAPLGTKIKFAQEYDYANADVPRGIEQAIGRSGSGGMFGLAVWGQFAWGEQIVGTAEAYIAGSGVNIGMLIRSESVNAPPHTIHGVTLYYSIRGRKL